MSLPQKVKTQLILPGEATTVSLSLPADLSFEDWQSVGEQLAHAERAVMWWMGDWWNYGEKHYGDMTAQALDSDYSYQTWRNAAWVARKIEPSRRLDNVSWSIHQEAARLEKPEDQDSLLAWACDENATVNEARREIRKRKATENLHERQFPTGKYGLIYADPPWEYEHSKTDNRRIENHYPTMPLEAICQLPVAKLADEDCVLFLWATSPKLAEALQVVDAWGFTYRTQAVWVKPQVGMGYYFRQRHEPLLVAVRGEPAVPEPQNRPPSVIEHPREKHSAKPPQVYGLIETMYPGIPKIELFSREARDGWHAWGNQLAE